ncbi:SDR family NAD(P)-dependent oxidoreductase [Frankia canadensis]|nr:SDR family NAD(P)-dependent oxidoreductase [Frankia canadensis]
MTECSGRVALVTGAASGIGAACARLLASAGAQVVVTDRQPDGIKEVAAQIERGGGDAIAVEADVTDPDAMERAVQAAVGTFGKLDLAVNNAGVTAGREPVGTTPAEDWQRVLDVNLSGVFYSMRAEITAMLHGGTGGSIVNMASVLGMVGFAGSAPYVAAKHGVVGLTKTAALEYAARRIRVNAVAPGFVDTALIHVDGRPQRGAALLTPINRLGTVNEVAEVVVFLLSDRASLVTGSVYLADGGLSAR